MIHDGVSHILTRFRNIRNIHFIQDTVSVHRPSFYAHRFQKFMAEKVFKKIPSRKYLLYHLLIKYRFNYERVLHVLSIFIDV